MRTIWLVMKHTIGTTLRQKSFWLFTLLMPAFFLGIQLYSVLRESGAGSGGGDSGETKATVEESSTSTDRALIGLVDAAGLIQEIPPRIPAEVFLPFSDQTSARSALEAGEIEQYVYIAADYLASGEVTVYDRNFLIRASGAEMGVAFGSVNEWMLRYLIEVNLTGDEKLVSRLMNPVPAAAAEQHRVRPAAGGRADDQALAQIVASATPFIYYFILIVVSGYLMRSVVAEKESRTVEVLLLSVRPHELMVGKILGMSVVAWAQLLAWLGAAVLMLDRGSDWLNVTGFDFPPGFFIWALLFLVFGYLLYATVMAAAGAMAPNAREGGKVTWLLILPLMPTMMFGSTFLEDPHGTIALALSLFPLSAPSAMVTRVAVAEVPLWQPIVSLLGLAGSSCLAVLLGARFFRADNLLSQAAFNWRRFATGWQE